MTKGKGILLFSGGLDSVLAAKVLQEQNIDLIGLHFILPYFSIHEDPENFPCSKIAKEINLELRHHRCGQSYIDMLKNPPHGYGKNINPCIDCKLYFIQTAMEYMERENADFIATGEVVGQRPMSQRKDTLLHMENISSLKGKLLRPLSAKILKPTIAEEKGLIDREKLLGLNGRGRTAQMELAKKFNIEDYESPSGGCKFTEKNIARRMFDILNFKKEITNTELYLCTIGRHYRYNKDLKVIVARNKRECEELEKNISHGGILMIPRFSGPSLFVDCPDSKIIDDNIESFLSIINRFGKPSITENLIDIFNKEKRLISTLKSEKEAQDKFLEGMRI